MSLYFTIIIIFIIFLSHGILSNQTQVYNKRTLNIIETEDIYSNSIPFPILKIINNKYYPIEIGNPNNDILSSLTFTKNGKQVQNLLILDNSNDQNISNSRYERNDICISNLNQCDKYRDNDSIIKCKLKKNPLSCQIIPIKLEYSIHRLIPLNYWTLRIESGIIYPLKIDIDGKINSELSNDIGEYSTYLLSKFPFWKTYLFLINGKLFEEIIINENKEWISFGEKKMYSLIEEINGEIKKIMKYENLFFILVDSTLYLVDFQESLIEFPKIEENVSDFLLNEKSILIIKNEDNNIRLILYKLITNWPTFPFEAQINKTMIGNFLVMDYIYHNHFENDLSSNYYYIAVCTKLDNIGYYELFYFTYGSSNDVFDFISVNQGKIYFSNEFTYKILIDSYKGTLYNLIGNNSGSLEKIDIYHLNDLGNRRFEYVTLNISQNFHETILVSENNYIVPLNSTEKTILIYGTEKSYVINHISSFFQEFKCLFKEEGIYQQLYNIVYDCSDVNFSKKCSINKKINYHVVEDPNKWFSNRYKIIIWSTFGMSIFLFVIIIIHFILLCREKRKSS